MQSAGDYLKAIRREKGCSIEEVSKATKIQPSVLRALEEGRIDNVDKIYLKGFLKLYCRFLNIDWDGFSRDYSVFDVYKNASKDMPVKKEAIVNTSKQSGLTREGFSLVEFIIARKRIIAITCAVLVFLIMVFLAYKNRAVFQKTIFQGAVFKARKAKEKAGKPKPSAPSESKKPQGKKAQSKKAQNEKEGLNNPSRIPIPQGGEKDAKSSAKNINMVIRAQEDSFLTIRVDGKIVYQRMMYKGNAEAWKARNNIEFSVGNAGGIILEINGQVFSPLGKKGQVIKNIRVDRSELSIP